jgi:hypothetical protein
MATPYCNVAYFSLRSRGWMRLWNFDPRQFVAPKLQELGCLVVGSFVVFFACVVIGVMSSDSKSKWHRLGQTVGLIVLFLACVIPLSVYGVWSIQRIS